MFSSRRGKTQAMGQVAALHKLFWDIPHMFWKDIPCYSYILVF
jgi:hypothetical protein